MPAGNIKILACLDANHQIGFGHAVRVSSILHQLKFAHSVILAGDAQLLNDMFPWQRVYPISVTHHNAFFALLDEVKPDLILIDHPSPGAGFWEMMSSHASGIPVVAIDDEGGEFDADLIVNGTVPEQYHQYTLLKRKAKLLLGEEYALIRPIFGKTTWTESEEASVVIVVGSADRASSWASLLASGMVDISKWGRVRMIVGRAFPNMSELEQSCSEFGITLESGLSGEHMAVALSQASVVLITGGMVVYEAIAVGVPAVVFPQVENMIPEAEWFAERGCIVNLGYEDGMNADLISEKVLDLLSSSSKRISMSTLQREVIDGEGISRVANEISQLLTNSSIPFRPEALN